MLIGAALVAQGRAIVWGIRSVVLQAKLHFLYSFLEATSILPELRQLDVLVLHFLL